MLKEILTEKLSDAIADRENEQQDMTQAYNYYSYYDGVVATLKYVLEQLDA